MGIWRHYRFYLVSLVHIWPTHTMMNERLLRMAKDACDRAEKLKTKWIEVSAGGEAGYGYQERIDGLTELAEIFEEESRNPQYSDTSKSSA